jgi:hypothetical protein
MVQGAGLPQHGIDQGCLTVIDVRDDGYVAKVWARVHVGDCRSVGIQSRKRRKGPVKASQIGTLKAKKKCCRSKPRCKRCPVVLHKVRKAELSGVRGKELAKVFKRARKA